MNKPPRVDHSNVLEPRELAVSLKDTIQVSPFIDGATTDSIGESSMDIYSPANGKLLFSIPAGSIVDVDRAVASGRRVFEAGHWSEGAPSFRKRIMHRFADLIESNASWLDALDATEMGKPVSEFVCNAAKAAGLVRFHAEAVDKIFGEVFASDKNSLVTQRLVARGVVAAIVPWNFPTYVAALKLAPALATGNSVVLKPSELSSRSAIVLAQLAVEAGIPLGVLNVTPGLGQTVGQALGLHNDVDMLTFTGSTAVGKLMLQYAGRSNLKIVLAECGGKSPQIVFADGVDLDAASKAIARALVINQGQVCSVGSRLLVQRSIESTIIEKITEHLQAIVMGDPLDKKTTFGPIASSKQCTRVMQYIENARDQGADLVVGGRRALVESGGYFVEPTVFRNVAPMSTIAQEEVFGPVLSVLPFDDEADAIRLANITSYGLMAYVWAASLSTGIKVAKGIRSGVIVNAVPSQGEGEGFGFSFEPARQSGVGVEGGVGGMKEYLRRQLVRFNHG